ncbi:hypothetical protein GCM10011608_59690 [Micromonospora sonchi]|uniref:Toprim domain-containing protein n=1 Tax=Micromonospora sonchi TaxID=1763543 RepID=A0A917X4X7_9ACTN|nr:toprim domain-containing protein [Micromonospora sonchi]GGM66506.1 hypothetical protein GCM10011608_59690 [Micromonospora sonchi]
MAAEQRTPTPERLYAVNAAAARFYADCLPTSPKAASYLTSHGISAAPDPTGPWQVGYAPGRWTDLATHLQAAGFTAGEVTAAGLGFIHRRSKHLLDRFRDRIMFPITDVHNRVVGFTARDLSGRAEARWINTPETAVYRKRSLLYGLGQQLAHRPAGTGTPMVFVVEGAADVLAMHRMATARAADPEAQPVYAVSPCGTNLTDEQLGLLQQALAGAQLVLAFDGDDGGRRAAGRAYPIAARWPGKVSGVHLPPGQDPADMLVSMDPISAINEIIGAVQPLAQLQMTNTISQLYATRRITDPARFAEDRITAYRAIAELFVDAPEATRAMAEAAAEQLGLESTDVARGVIEAWEARTRSPSGLDPPPAPKPPEPQAGPGSSSDPPAADAHSAADAGEPALTVSAIARSAGGQAIVTTATSTRHDPRSGITVWALADGIGQHQQAAAAAEMAADIAATVTAHSMPAAGLHAARAAVNALYDGVHPSQAGDASLLVVSAHPAPDNRLGVRFEIAWAGNCRAYTISAGRLVQVTADHTAARQRRDHGEHVQPGSIADVILTSSVRSGDISVCPLDDGPLLICTRALHRAVAPAVLEAELAGMSDVHASTNRLTGSLGPQSGAAALILIHARSAPPSRVTTIGAAHRPTVAATGSAAALARTSFTNGAVANPGPPPGLLSSGQEIRSGPRHR